MSCSLCELKTILHTYDDTDPRWIVMDCMTCFLPMVVWRGEPPHTMEISEQDTMEMEEALNRAAQEKFGGEDFYIDKKQNKIPDHLHWHARPNGWSLKVYFAPNWGQTPEEMLRDYALQSPNGLAKWESMEATTNPDEAKFLIIQDNCDIALMEKFLPHCRLYFSREAVDFNSHQKYPPSLVTRASFWDDSGLLWTKWIYPNKATGGINKTYDTLIAEKHPPKKTNFISCVQSNKQMTVGHVLRQNFINEFLSLFPDELHLFGSIRTANKELPDNDKYYALSPYKYCLTFDNQDFIKNFFGTQFTDAILYWTVPIYWGGAELSKFFPEDAFIQIDIKQKGEAERVMEILHNDNYEKRIPALKEARNLILNKYNVWPTIYRTIKEIL